MHEKSYLREHTAREYSNQFKDVGQAGVGTGAKQSPDDRTLAAEAMLKAAAEHRSLRSDQILMLKMLMPSVRAQWHQLSEGIYQWNRHQGFWTTIPDGLIPPKELENLKKMEKLGLIVTELAEAMEAVRKGDVANELEELVDVFVRLFDYLGGFGLGSQIGYAFEEKMLKNYERPYRHGKAF